MTSRSNGNDVRLTDRRLTAVFLLALFFLISCDRRITTGSFKGLEIGMTKSEVVAASVGNGVPAVDPYLERHITVTQRKDAADLFDRKAAPAICINDNAGFVIHISFDKNDKAVLKHFSVPARELSAEVSNLTSRQTVVEFLKTLIERRQGIVATNCILGVVEVDLNSKDAVDKLESLDSWFYYLPGTYSNAVLRFDDARLVRIDYRWRPVEM